MHPLCSADYHYTDRMMAFAYERFLPDGMKWRDMFDMVCALPCSAPVKRYNSFVLGRRRWILESCWHCLKPENKS